MPSFADKKAQRNIKQSRTFINKDIADRKESDSGQLQISNFEQPASDSDAKAVSVITSPDSLYADLPLSLDNRKDATRGRGLWSTVAIRKGSIILKTSPLIYVLSIANLSSHCSCCVQPARGQGSVLKRCAQCRHVWYCSSTCQNTDWQLHKHECSAITRWTTASPDGSAPPEVVRALGRILFTRKVLGDDNTWWKEIQALQSNRSSLPPSATESFTQLAHALVRYLGVTSPTELEPYGLYSAGNIVDLISRFTINAFTLTSPILSSLGVCLSPVASLLNHSCQPNAVVVFPGSSSSKPRPILNVIALKDISPNQEILVSYVDVTFATPQRQEILKETYNFTCACPLCSKTTTKPDQREVVLCPGNCGGMCMAPFSSSKQLSTWRCSSCNITYPSSALDKLNEKRFVGQEALDKASKLQSSDPEQALKITTNIIPVLSNNLPPSAHPYLNILRLHQSLLTEQLSTSDPNVLDDCIRTAGLVVTGLTAILDEGHPILGVALVELGKLLAVDEPPESSITTAFDFPPRGPRRLVLALETLKRAFENLKVGFGRENEGGTVGIQVREDIVKLEREAQVWQYGIRNLWEDTVLQRKYEKNI